MKKKIAIFLSALMLAMTIMPVNLTVSAANNSAPNVLPAIREWKGSTGNFVPNKETKLVNSSSVDAVEKVSGFFSDMLSMELTIDSNQSGDNEIVFVIDQSLLEQVGDEGYVLTATETKIEVKAPTNTGLLYGGITIVQSIYADGFFPCGEAVDYPAYKVRSGLIDVARLYMPMHELMNVTRYMAWFKLNEIHIHINDNGKNDYSAFRLESDIPGLTATDGYYTKEEYRQYQKDAQSYGVTILTEIDSPHHARCFSTVNIDGWTPKLLTEADGVQSYEANRALDIRDEKTVQLIESIFTEYLGGDNPVILNDTIHIGMDEYPKIFPAESQVYINRIIKHVNSLGYTARFWSSFGVNGFLNGATLDSGMDFTTIYWDSTHSGYEETYNLNCGIVNYLNNYLYVVPGWNDQPWESFEDFFDVTAMKTLYEKWQVSKWTIWGTDKHFNGGNIYYPDDERMLGAAFSIWNDYGSAWFGLTYVDVIDRLRNIAPFVAEKCWTGEDTKKIKFDDYYSRLQTHCWRAGDVDIFNRDLPEGGINIDFENSIPDYVTVNGKIENGKFVLDGTSYLSTAPKYDLVGMPNALSFNIKLDELPSERAYIFQSSDRTYLGETKSGTTNIFIEPDGTIGFESLLTESDNEFGKYEFTYEYKLVVGEETKITLTCALPVTGKPSVTSLIVNDGKIYSPKSSLSDKVTASFTIYGTYSTLTIPLSKIGLGVKGTIDNITVSGETFDPSRYILNSNIAYQSKVITSNENGVNMVDGNSKTKTTLSKEQKFTVDLGAIVPFNQINIEYAKAPESYEILVSDSLNGEYSVVYEGNEANLKLDTPITARYISFVQKSGENSEINEFKVVSPDLNYFKSYSSKVSEFVNNLDKDNQYRGKIVVWMSKLNNALNDQTSSLCEINSYVSQLDELMTLANQDNIQESVEPSEENSQNSNNEQPKSNLGLIIGGVAAALVATLGVVVTILKRKKK